MTPLATGLPSFLTDGGEMAGRIAALDWTRTPLGPIVSWPQSLRTATQIMMASRYPMFIWWGDDLVNIYNDAYIPVLGKRHPEALGRPAAQIWEEIWETIGPQQELVYRERTSTWNEELLLVMERNDFTEETYFTFSYSPIGGEDGCVTGLLGVCTEDTARVLNRRRLKTLRDLGDRTLSESKTVEEALAAAAATLAENPYDVPFALIYLLDTAGAEAVLGARAGGGAGRFLERVPLRAGDDPWRFRRVLETGKAQLVDDLPGLFGEIAGGAWQERVERALVAPLARSGVQDVPAGFLVAGLSPRLRFDDDYRGFLELAAGQTATLMANVRAYAEERRRAEALAEIDRAKTAFFSNVSHEFRTPLTLMLGPLESLLARDSLEAGDRERLETAHRNSLRLLKLVNSLLDFARIEAGRVRASYVATDLAAATTDLAAHFRSAVESAGLELVVDCEPLSEDVYVDREMWEKIVLNLLSNAFKFTFAGSIAVRLRSEGGHAVLRVADTGIGIPASELPRIFERFHRVEGATGRTYEGTGIGLALIEELVRLHGGHVTVASTEGQGSEFTVRIPFGRAHLPAGGVATSPQENAGPSRIAAEAFRAEALNWIARERNPAGGAASESANRPRILLADDNADMRDHIRHILGEHYEVAAVGDGQTALEQARRIKPHLIVSDIMMPRLDGFGLLRALRQDAELRDVPVILLSARAGEEARAEGIEAGADDYVTKPFSARELVARVQTTLELQRVRREAREQIENVSARLLSALQSARMMAWEWDLRTGKVLHSENALEVAGLALEQAVEQDWAAVHPEDADRVRAEVQRATAEGSAFRAQFRLIRPDTGSAQWMEAHGRVLCSESGEPAKLTGVLVDITERRRVEALIEGQKRAFEAAVAGAELDEVLRVLAEAAETQSEGARAAVLVADGGGLRCAAAPRMAEGFGKAGALWQAMAGAGDLMIASDVERTPGWEPHLEAAREFGIRASWSQPVRSAGGTVLGCVVVCHGAPKEPGAGELEGLGYVARAAAVLIERAREAAERRIRTAQFETLLNQAPIGVYVVDNDGNVRAANPAAERTFGMGELAGRKIDEVMRSVWPEAVAGELAAHFRRTLETGEPYVAPEMAALGQDTGVRAFYDWRVDRIPLPDGGLGAVCYFRDITVEKQAQERIREAAARLHFMAESMPQKIFTARPDGEVDYLNRQWLEYTGASEGQMRGWNWTQFVHPDDVEDNLRRWRHSLATAEPFQTTQRFRRADGAYRWHLSRAHPLRGSDGAITMWIGSNTDIHEQKRTEEELRRANHDLEQFAYTATHDLQEPLRGVKIYSELLAKRYRDRLDEQAQQYLDYLCGGAMRMELLVRDLLSYTQAGKLEGPVEAADANSCLEAALANLRSAIEESGAEVSAGELPALRVHRTHLQQLFQNLIGNAIKYRDQDRRPQIEISAVRTHEGWQFSIHDNGIGIDPQYQERIFGLFKRLHTGSRYTGTGIGLAICQRIVEQYQGRICVESAPGDGAKFFFTLPA